jgi:peptidoglycan/LPS O-acetylase OafA/YrhL
VNGAILQVDPKKTQNAKTEALAATHEPGLGEAHTGLRGLLASWIVLFHAVIYSLGWNLHGSAIMPVFFLLAGYSLAIGYGGNQSAGHQTDKANEHHKSHRLEIKRFYRNRFARIAPVYYVTMLLALPPAVFSQSWVHAEDIGRVFATNLFAVQMWFSLPPQSFDGPAWTISTLAFFYLVFPWLLRWHQGQSDHSLSRWIVILFALQAIVYFGISLGVAEIDRTWAFWAAHAWPVSRLPVFDMGLVAGLLVLRQRCPDRDKTLRIMGVRADERGIWPGRTDRRAVFFAALIIGLSVLSILGTDLLGSWWVQGVFPYLMLQVIVGLSMAKPNQHFRTRNVLNWPPLLFIGKISLALYLVHEIVIYYVKWATRPDQPFFFEAMPVWGILLVIPVSVALAVLLERFFERPARSLLRGTSRGS